MYSVPVANASPSFQLTQRSFVRPAPPSAHASVNADGFTCAVPQFTSTTECDAGAAVEANPVPAAAKAAMAAQDATAIPSARERRDDSFTWTASFPLCCRPGRNAGDLPHRKTAPARPGCKEGQNTQSASEVAGVAAAAPAVSGSE